MWVCVEMWVISNKQTKCSSSFFFLLQRENQFTAHCNGGASSHRVSASRHTNTSHLFIIDLIVLLKTTRGSSKSKDMPESRKSKIAADSVYMSPISPLRIKSPQTFLMSKNFNEPRDILYFPCLEKSKKNSSTNLFLWGWETYISADIIQQKSLHLPKASWKIIFPGSLDTLATLEWHKAGWRLPTMLPDRWWFFGGKWMGEGRVNGVILICLWSTAGN